MNYYLLLKTHNQTGLNYLCKFSEGVKKSPHKYKGSGKYWKRHIKKHGYDVETKILYQGQSEQELSACAIFWSNVYDVVKNKKFANLIPENGLDGGGVKGQNLGNKYCLGMKRTKEFKQKLRIVRLGSKQTKEAKQKISIAQLGNKNWLGKKHSEETKRKISLTLFGKKLSEEHKRKESLARLKYLADKPC